MQKTEMLDFCFVLEAEVMLVLDTAEVRLRRGDMTVVRSSNYA